MSEVSLGEAIPLPKAAEGDGRVSGFDGWTAVASEGVRAVVHERLEVVGDSLSGDKG